MPESLEMAIYMEGLHALPMDLEIRRHMESPCGRSELGIQAFVSNGRYLCLLFNRETLLAGMTLQKIRNRVYIRNVDTTGYGRGHARGFILSVLKTLAPGFCCCFSVPRSEYIFGGSSRNREKRIRGPGELLEYWIEVFESLYDDVHVWSNHYENISYPFKHIDEVVYFEDDPKEKLRRHFEGGLEEMFAALLCRADFASGSLVYGQSRGDDVCSVVETSIGDVDGMEAMLRTLDFSSISKARRSTKKFICEFELAVEYFQGQGAVRPKKNEEAFAVMNATNKS
uniref:histone acetyltransferase n=1 Tax=Encephalitozoon cuniculi TaxID=6035 RepID=M1KL97_ENCCN|nr:hypothetical protein ECU01_0860 [Encephalitozoon cuniculi]